MSIKNSREQNQQLFKQLLKGLNNLFEDFEMVPSEEINPRYVRYAHKRDDMSQFTICLDEHAGKVNISPAFREGNSWIEPIDEKGNRVSIDVGFSINRSAEDIYNGINSRFLGPYLSALKYSRERIMKQKEYEARKLQTLLNLSDKTGFEKTRQYSHDETKLGEYTYHLKTYNTGIYDYVHDILVHSGDNVSVNLSSMTEAKAIKLLEFIKNNLV